MMSAPSPARPRRAAFLALTGALALGLGGLAWWRLSSSVEQALGTESGHRRPLSFVSLPVARELPERWGSADVQAVVVSPSGLFTGGGSGIQRDGQAPPELALPTLRVAALADWRGRLVAALAAGGVYRLAERQWEELRSGFGKLNVRAMTETSAGELLLGAREGLFRAAHGSARLERLDSHPVRAVAAGPGFVLAGGEQGLFRVEPGRVRLVPSPDPWIECVALDGDSLWVVTAAGLARGPVSGTLAPVSGGEDVVTGVLHEGDFLGLAQPPAATLSRFGRDGRVREEPLPSPARRLHVSQGTLFADTLAGLFRRAASGWVPVPSAVPVLPGERSHVGALARLGERVVAGLFDGGLLMRDGRAWKLVEGSQAWGVNALLPTGGELYVASLRGAARFDGRSLRALEGPGAAFSLAVTDQGVAVGYGQGVLLPGGRLLSAFHGLPGNQALALASARPALYVGTPSGLGAIEERRVRWQVTQGEGRLPHGWVTALAVSGEALYVGTYGGGVVRRLPASQPERAARAGRFEPFVETEGLKINTGCLVEAHGRVYAGSDGRGLWRLSLDGRRFQPWKVTLPSPRVTALLPEPDGLLVGTDEGLTLLPYDSSDTEEH